MGAARAGRTGADPEPAGELGLAGGCKRCAFLVAHADPFDIAAANRVGERIERVADQSEDMLDPDLLKRADQDVRYRLGHLRLLLLQPYRSRVLAAISALDVGLRTIIACRQLVMPTTILVFI